LNIVEFPSHSVCRNLQLTSNEILWKSKGNKANLKENLVLDLSKCAEHPEGVGPKLSFELKGGTYGH
jgi:hypothetical protein